MNNTTRWTPRLILIFALFFTLACGAASQAASTQAPVATDAPAETEAPAATDTPVAAEAPSSMPDLSQARIVPADLPAGFEEILIDEAALQQAETDMDGFTPGAVFTFVNPDNFQVIFGMTLVADSGLDQLSFEMALDDSENTLKEFAQALGVFQIHDEKKIEGLDGLGDEYVAMTMGAYLETTAVRVDGAMFQRGRVDALIMSVADKYSTPSISLEELGTVFDKHIQETLATTE